jgi:hypothetical protein
MILRDMTTREECLANAVECQRMARITRDNTDRITWLDMAISWMRKASERERKTRRHTSEAGRAAAATAPW